MTATATAPREGRSLELRFIQLYFWMYWLLCINGTYLNLYLKREAGLTGTQIGVVTPPQHGHYTTTASPGPNSNQGP